MSGKLMGALVFCSVFLLIGALKPQSNKSSQRLVGLPAGLSGIFYALCDLYWHYYRGSIRSRMTATTFYVVWHLLGGVFLAAALAIIFPKRTMSFLWMSAVAFVGLNCLAFFLYERGHITQGLIASCDGTGFLIGTLSRYAITLCLGPPEDNGSAG